MKTESDWLKVFSVRETALGRLFCFHYAGGGASAFHSWVRHLPPNLEVCGVQLPGRENRLFEEPLKNFDDLIEKIGAAIEPLTDKPYIFFGHSMGALLSFEVACRLAKMNRPLPAQLFVSGRQAPQLPRKFPPIHHLPENEFIVEIKKFEGIPAEILAERELRELFFPTLRADLEICEKYVFADRPVLSVPIRVYGGTDDAGVTPEELEKWRERTENYRGTELFEGGHFYFRNSRENFLERFSDDLSEVMRKIRLRESSSIFFSKPNL